MKFQTILEEHVAEIVEKKSRFIAQAFPVSSEEEALVAIEQIKKQYWDARHHCFAYVLRGTVCIERFSDDGEPSGTAGKPILEVIKGLGLENVLVVVTRYFGGTLLGTGGLVRAYSSASRECLAHSSIITRIQGFKLKISADYALYGKIQYLLAQKEVPIVETSYTECVNCIVFVPEEEEGAFQKMLVEETNGQVEAERVESCWFTLGK
jgi:uncharacterized YigZ family protein